MQASLAVARSRSPRRASPDDAHTALAAWQRGEVAAAETICRDLLRRRPADTQAARLMGVIAYHARRYPEALSLWRRVAVGPAADASDHSNLGAALRAVDLPLEAEQAYRRAIECDRGFAAAHYNLANLLSDTDRLHEAADSFRAALELRADYAEASHGLGLVLQRVGRLADAVTAFRDAARLAPGWTEAWTNLGVALLGQDQSQEAEAALRQALTLKATHAPAHGNLSAVHLRAGRAIAAEAASRAAIEHAPVEQRWHTNLGIALQMQGRYAEAEACYRRGLALKPDYATGHGNLLFALNYRTDLTAEAIFQEYRAWDERHARPLAPAAPDFELDRTPGRRLRVGYVSADFRTHAAALFAEPLLTAHDRTRVELFCYAEVAVPDATTARFRALAENWRSTVGLSDAALAELIRADRIDVLVDLAGHTAGNRLLAFARRPAPVQVAYLLGHGYSTGLSAMDAFLADAALVPEGYEKLFSERVVRLPRIPLVYAPPAEMPPVAALPAPANGFVTFGHFGRPERLNEGVIAAWASILRGVPGSRLVLNSRPFEEAAFAELFASRFAAHGIGRERLDLICTSPQTKTWAAYGGIDIALDPFPHNAGTTTIEALWQGVPVVTLAGRPSVGRFGASILGAVGLDDWVMPDEAGYVARAIAAASDLGALAALRAGLRERVAASPLRDADGLARHVEHAYQALWEQWRSGVGLSVCSENSPTVASCIQDVAACVVPN